MSHTRIAMMYQLLLVAAAMAAVRAHGQLSKGAAGSV